MQPAKFRILSAITAGSLALAVVAITASSGASQTAKHAALAAQTESFMAPGIPDVVFNPGPFTDSAYLQRSLIQRIPTSSSDSAQTVAGVIAGAICARYFPEVANPSCTGVLTFLMVHGGYIQLARAKEQNSCLRIRWLGLSPLSGLVIPSVDSNPAYCLSVADPGFEGQPSDGISSPWLTEGPDPKGIDRGKGLSHNGSNNAWIRTNSRNWNAIDQVVGISHSRKYQLTAWIRSYGVPDLRKLAVRNDRVGRRVVDLPSEGSFLI